MINKEAIKINKDKLPFVVGGIVAVVLVALVTVVLLANNSENSDPSSDSTVNARGANSPAKRADSLSEEASALVSTDPKKAQEKFEEAEKLYAKEGDQAKASEARRDAASAEAAHTAMLAAGSKDNGASVDSDGNPVDKDGNPADDDGKPAELSDKAGDKPVEE